MQSKKEAASSYLRVAAALHVVPYLYVSPPGKINEEMRRKPGSFPSYKFTHTLRLIIYLTSDTEMETDTLICGVCSLLRHITNTSTHWCQECEEAICDECKVHHTLLKATRSHEIIPISNLRSLPSYISDIKQSCIYHHEKYQQYCNDHAFPICFKCITDHQKCTVIPLEEVTSNVKTSDQFKDIETRLVGLLDNVDIINRDRQDNAASIKDSKNRHLAEIQQIRLEINRHLDNIENQIITDLEEKEYQCNNTIQNILLSIKEKKT
ncbi:unnamed protein product [Mytilus edulis]|uniref:B box-type domain-containing protein n=1 Tax=Mytilus edulis TaxID=6550 RepID=A0A8S3UQS1_MYTED|nr:unnamed protein product [Mytilus edulis]